MRCAALLAEGRDADRATLAEVMTREPAAVPSSAMAMEALRLMQDGGFDHVPVVEGGRAVGLVSHSDFLGQEQTRLEAETRVPSRPCASGQPPRSVRATAFRPDAANGRHRKDRLMNAVGPGSAFRGGGSMIQDIINRATLPSR